MIDVSDDGWCYGIKEDGTEGWLPFAYVSVRLHSSTRQGWLEKECKEDDLIDSPELSTDVYVSKYDFEPRFEDELALSAGDEVVVLQQLDGGWWEGRTNSG